MPGKNGAPYVKGILENSKFHATPIILAIGGFVKHVKKPRMKPRHMKVKPHAPYGFGPGNISQLSNLRGQTAYFISIKCLTILMKMWSMSWK